jgi:hypothetical protein
LSQREYDHEPDEEDDEGRRVGAEGAEACGCSAARGERTATIGTNRPNSITNPRRCPQKVIPCAPTFRAAGWMKPV